MSPSDGSSITPIAPSKFGAKADWDDMREFMSFLEKKGELVVDEDIDIWDYESVHWALSTRVRADRDVTISPRRAGQWLDPAVSLREKGWQTQMGIDATLPTEEYRFWGENPPVTVDDPEIVAKVRDKWGSKANWR